MSISEMIEGQGESRIFVPLSKEPYRWFEEGRKLWELRKYGRQFTERHVKVGRRVELRHGYSSHRSLWGVVKDTITATSVDDFFARVDYQIVIPSATSKDEAIRIANTILNICDGAEEAVFAFRVELGA